MKRQADFLYRQNADLDRQQPIAAAQNRIGIDGTLRLDRRHLGVSVDSGVRAPGSRNVDAVIEELRKGAFKFTLNSGKFRLDLPTVKPRAVVCHRELEVAHAIRL